jgi:hypothetical protein
MLSKEIKIVCSTWGHKVWNVCRYHGFRPKLIALRIDAKGITGKTLQSRRKKLVFHRQRSKTLSCRMLWLLFHMKVSCGPVLAYVVASFPHEGVIWTCPVVCCGFFSSWRCHVDLSCRMLWLLFLMKVSCGSVLSYVMASFPHEGVMWTCPVVCYGFFSSWRCHVDLS